ncbi:hypothetical protein GCM10011492_25870 [Flexivirga endophytica]|uniref:DUF2630 family protein n=1 Tax=Flexivirga endophytica TaxID=1849103 RepID=A0A916T726_9MICO|nr:DUF2630 family protein [Flexivirga endophytica]GGB34071.1 hypothetical protein GCM10011492_25870 [Flexivirga endophytica]GHB42035.1 hypothetical protein GCM10008112_08260 [Flexivirga endophytica]
MDDKTIRDHITELIATEHELRTKLGRGEISAPDEHAQLREAEVQLDRLWDLLRQRQARREFAQDPADASERSAAIVENYRE